MARTFAGFTATSASALATAVNAAFALLTNPTIRGLQLSVERPQRRSGIQYRLSYSYDTGGSALATPFLINPIEATNMADLQTAVNTFLGNSYFFTNPILYVLDGEDSVRYPLYGALMLYNTTTGASANCVLTNTSI